MIKVPFKEFRVGPFMPVFHKLTSYPKFGPKMLYAVTRIQKKLEKGHSEWNEQFVKLVKQYCDKDAKGEILPRKNEKGQDIPNSFEIPDAQSEAWKAAVEELDKIEFEIDRHKLSIEDLLSAGIEFSAQECVILEPLLTDGEEEAAPALKSVK
jgi:hypothetical protein